MVVRSRVRVYDSSSVITHTTARALWSRRLYAKQSSRASPERLSRREAVQHAPVREDGASQTEHEHVRAVRLLLREDDRGLLAHAVAGNALSLLVVVAHHVLAAGKLFQVVRGDIRHKLAPADGHVHRLGAPQTGHHAAHVPVPLRGEFQALFRPGLERLNAALLQRARRLRLPRRVLLLDRLRERGFRVSGVGDVQEPVAGGGGVGAEGVKRGVHGDVRGAGLAHPGRVLGRLGQTHGVGHLLHLPCHGGLSEVGKHVLDAVDDGFDAELRHARDGARRVGPLHRRRLGGASHDDRAVQVRVRQRLRRGFRGGREVTLVAVLNRLRALDQRGGFVEERLRLLRRRHLSRAVTRDGLVRLGRGSLELLARVAGEPEQQVTVGAAEHFHRALRAGVVHEVPALALGRGVLERRERRRFGGHGLAVVAETEQDRLARVPAVGVGVVARRRRRGRRARGDHARGHQRAGRVSGRAATRGRGGGRRTRDPASGKHSRS
mmetsp:Transcript_9658/g.40984  ORF Transcript_9658/g.40984 Transcript_9658/m.40984 type:complete len:494 (-) Transcript_9658:149-1630(-)